MKLIHATLVKDEEHCISRMLESVLPYVDESYVLIDDRTTDNTEKILVEHGCHTKLVRFENFGKCGNTVRKWVSGKSDWVFELAPDETIGEDFGKMLKPLAEEIQNTAIDGVWFCRRHWCDLEMENEYTKQNWYPDWQFRLYRNDYPRLHLVNYVHETPVGLRASIRVTADINHFNVYWKPRMNYDFEKMNQLYISLQEKQRRDRGYDIWPEE